MNRSNTRTQILDACKDYLRYCHVNLKSSRNPLLEDYEQKLNDIQVALENYLRNIETDICIEGLQGFVEDNIVIETCLFVLDKVSTKFSPKNLIVNLILITKQILEHIINNFEEISECKASTISNNVMKLKKLWLIYKGKLLYLLGKATLRNHSKLLYDEKNNAAHKFDHTLVEEVSNVWIEAAEIYLLVNDLDHVCMIYKSTAELWYNCLDIEAFQYCLDRNASKTVNHYIADQASSMYLSAAKYGTKIITNLSDKITTTSSYIRSSNISTNSSGLSHNDDDDNELKQLLDKRLQYYEIVFTCCYYSGIATQICDDDDAIRSFESAKTMITTYKETLQYSQHYYKSQAISSSSSSSSSSSLTMTHTKEGIENNSNKTEEATKGSIVDSIKEELQRFSIACGDLSYHLSCGYYRQQKYDYAYAEALHCQRYYHCTHIQYHPNNSSIHNNNNTQDVYSDESFIHEYVDISRQRKCYELLALTTHAIGNVNEAEYWLTCVHKCYIAPYDHEEHSYNLIKLKELMYSTGRYLPDRNIVDTHQEMCMKPSNKTVPVLSNSSRNDSKTEQNHPTKQSSNLNHVDTEMRVERVLLKDDIGKNVWSKCELVLKYMKRFCLKIDLNLILAYSILTAFISFCVAVYFHIYF